MRSVHIEPYSIRSSAEGIVAAINETLAAGCSLRAAQVTDMGNRVTLVFEEASDV